MRLQDLAEMDVREAVQQVQEYFADFVVLDSHHFCVPVSRPGHHITLQPFNWDYANRHVLPLPPLKPFSIEWDLVH